jgi:hypothetical protein
MASTILPWLLLGDFNEIVALEEKFGREDRSFRQMARFREALADCSLVDLGLLGRSLRGLIIGRMMIWFGSGWTVEWHPKNGEFVP